MNWKNDDHRLNSSRPRNRCVARSLRIFCAITPGNSRTTKREKCLLVRRRMAGRLRFTSELVDGTQPAPGPPHAGCHNLQVRMLFYPQSFRSLANE